MPYRSQPNLLGLHAEGEQGMIGSALACPKLCPPNLSSISVHQCFQIIDMSSAEGPEQTSEGGVIGDVNHPAARESMVSDHMVTMSRIERPANDRHQGQEDGIYGIVESRCSAPVTDGIFNNAHNACFHRNLTTGTSQARVVRPFAPVLI